MLLKQLAKYTVFINFRVWLMGLPKFIIWVYIGKYKKYLLDLSQTYVYILPP